MSRANFLPAPAAFNLNQACCTIREAFGEYGIYLVGSALVTRDYRDVDVRYILPDDEFARLFPVAAKARAPQYDARWSLLCVALSEWLAARTGLSVDFQFQAQTTINEVEKGPRHALGFWLSLPKPTASHP